ncbi:MAG: hypothetical protein QOJ65_1590 [Fimbriimonadaceae bacterium]|jgi:DNA-binding MarR family transcriptional regulator|nr:hypothetical protein [Fimbriimonadaceae bacterium]
MTYQDPRLSPAYQLWLASNAWQRKVRRALEPFDLTHVQFVILASIDLLAREGTQPTQIAVCRFAALDENMTSQVVKTLIQKGLVRREQHADDARAKILALTKSGQETTCGARSAVKPATLAFFAPLGERADELTALLADLNANSQDCSG